MIQIPHIYPEKNLVTVDLDIKLGKAPLKGNST
jgi:hypothetical protein